MDIIYHGFCVSSALFVTVEPFDTLIKCPGQYTQAQNLH